LTVASWRVDLVSIKFFFLWISEIYITHKKQESGQLFDMKSWLFFSSIAKSSRKFYRFFNPPMAFCGLLSHVKKIVSLMFVSFRFIDDFFGFVSFLFCLDSLRFVSTLSCFVSVSFLVLQSPVFLFRSYVVVDVLPIFFMEYRINSKRDIYSMCRCCWNIATYKWKIDSGNISK